MVLAAETEESVHLLAVYPSTGFDELLDYAAAGRPLLRDPRLRTGPSAELPRRPWRRGASR